MQLTLPMMPVPGEHFTLPGIIIRRVLCTMCVSVRHPRRHRTDRAGWPAVRAILDSGREVGKAQDSYSCFTFWAAVASILLVEASTALLMAMCNSTNRGAIKTPAMLGSTCWPQNSSTCPWKPVLTSSER